MKQFWDERYGEEAYAYGEAPNAFFKEQLDQLTPGTILFPAEGEGRNAVYAATQGWSVTAFDLSAEGKKKALRLAEKHGATITYDVGALEALEYPDESFDALALVYVHFPAEKKLEYHKKLTSYLRKGGTLIFEAFSKEHLAFSAENPQAGGPKNAEMLYSIEELQSYFEDFDILYLEAEETELSEGLYHVGQSSVIRFVGRKK